VVFYFVVQSKNKQNMKNLMRLAAVLSFGSCLAAALTVIGGAISSPHVDSSPVLVIGLLLISAAFFAGSVIWFLAEKCYPTQNNE
jgi:hypothetical protein